MQVESVSWQCLFDDSNPPVLPLFPLAWFAREIPIAHLVFPFICTTLFSVNNTCSTSHMYHVASWTQLV